MDAIIVLLVLFVLDGEAHTFAVQTPSAAECIVLESKIAEALPRLRPGSDIVIRALPTSATADFASLRTEVARCLDRRAAA